MRPAVLAAPEKPGRGGVFEEVGGGEPFGVDRALEQRRDALDVGGARPRRGRARRPGRRGATSSNATGPRRGKERSPASSPALRLWPCLLVVLSSSARIALVLDGALLAVHARGSAPAGCRGRGAGWSRVGSTGGEGSGWQASPSQGIGGERFGEAAADAGVVEVDRAGVGGDQRAVGEEEGVGAVGGGVDEGGAARRRGRRRSARRSRPASCSCPRPGPPTRRRRCRRRSVLVSVRARASAESKKTRLPSAERTRGL